MDSLILQKDGIYYELNKHNLLAKVIHSPQARNNVFISRSINYQSQNYIITRIEEDSFKENRHIYSIEFPEDSELRSIGNRAFRYSSIEILHIPSSVESLEEGWCENTKDLNTIYLSSNNKNYKYLDNNHQIIIGRSNPKSNEFDTLVFASRRITRFTIPSSIKIIGPFSFNQSSLKTIKFEKNSNLETIEKYAFNNSHIQSIEIQPKVKILKDGWLGQRWNDVRVSISPENKVFKYINESMIVGKSNPNEDKFDVLVFACSNITEAIIPASIKHISSYSFFCCQNLHKIVFESDSNLISIGENAFFRTEIKEVSIPKSCKQIQKHAFDNCSKLKSINISPDSELISIPSKFLIETRIKSFTITNNIQRLEKGWCNCTECLNQVIISPENKNFAYLNENHKIIVGKSDINNSIFDVLIFACRDIKDVFIPSYIKYINPFAFQRCKKIKSIEFEKDSQLISIGKRSFSCISIESINIPSSVRDIASYSFSFCNKLTTVNIPENSQLETIGQYAFFHSPLENIFIPSKLSEFNLSNLDKLNKITISSGNQNFKFLNEVEKNIIISKSDSKSENFDVIQFAFRNIKKVFIPSFIKYIDVNAFANCLQLNELTFADDSQLISIEKNAFSSTNINQIIIPSSVKYIGEACFSASNIHRIEFEKDSQLTIFNNFLVDSTNIEYLSFPSSLKELRCEWSSCTNHLNQVFLPPDNKNFCYLDEEHKMIGMKSNLNDDAFDVLAFVCRDINNVSIPSSITQINSYAYAECSKIVDVFIPKNVKIICDFAFYGCKNIKSIEFEDDSSLESLGYNSFGYTNIKHLIIPKRTQELDLCSIICCNYLKSIEFLGSKMTFRNFLCSNEILVISFPNASKIYVNDDSFLIFSDNFSLFTCPYTKLEH